MPSFMKLAAAALAVAAPLVSAQTYSDCDPLEKTCPANKGSTESNLHFDFTQASALDQWKISGGNVPTGSKGAEFTINKEGDAPTLVSDFYFFYGELSIEMQSSPGQGIVSSAFLQSDDKDEVDWEALGTKSNTIETNYFGKGDTSTYDRETWVPVTAPQETFHTYTIKWTKETISWLIDGANVRTLNYNDAQGGARFPQTPMNIHVGIWAGGAPTNGQGTIDWAGGLTDYSKGPYSMYIKSINVKNDNPAESYTWSDKSGSSDSIKFTGSNAVTSRSTTTDAATSSSSEAASSTTESPSTTTTVSPSTTESTSSAATTLATKTSSSSSAASTAESSAGSTAASSSGAASASSSGASPSGSSSSGSGSSSSSGASPSGSSSSGSGSGSGSTSSSPSGSGSSTSASASASPSFNAAVSVAASYLGPVSLLGLVTAMLQL
ncbi:Concanavalin A-like lectin/glucanase subgroup [Penicillium samsonianum]|uniref:Concanavalin A-like lectin/glucanase subgroup n=1 Tax=Penicillium samsonianum TaxID=1882272 RepID=UPI002547F2A7|nr:Concanavalin A-like lectin/glucanase subgroup [Penicillium samsonianum]KAJ6118131.1 Concanavalin A-like lectin/glucanase subgroup [Penicillium samsonianum]